MLPYTDHLNDVIDPFMAHLPLGFF